MSQILAVPGSVIVWSKGVYGQKLIDMKEIVKGVDAIHLDSEGLYIYELDWYDFRPVENALIKLAKYIFDNRISAKGGIFAIFGSKSNGLIAQTDSHKISLKGGGIKYSRGEIKAIRKINRRK